MLSELMEESQLHHNCIESTRSQPNLLHCLYENKSGFYCQIYQVRKYILKLFFTSIFKKFSVINKGSLDDTLNL